jgi:hypothetical protein
MELTMEFKGPSTTDYENVSSLNRAFLTLLRREPAARCCLAGLREPLAGRLVTLTEPQADRLAKTPFLLMSFRERDDRFWDGAFSTDLTRDLFAVPPSASDELGRLISAGLGFVWQLAKQNPYAARLICGASLHWCEQLTELTFLNLLAIAGNRNEVLTLRYAADAELWTKLLQCGTSREHEVRHAAHISALQSVLTRAAAPAGRKWATAACAAKSPSLRVADERES